MINRTLSNLLARRYLARSRRKTRIRLIQMSLTGIRALAVPFLFPVPVWRPFRRASALSRARAREWTAIGFRMIKPSLIRRRTWCLKCDIKTQRRETSCQSLWLKGHLPNEHGKIRRKYELIFQLNQGSKSSILGSDCLNWLILIRICVPYSRTNCSTVLGFKLNRKFRTLVLSLSDLINASQGFRTLSFNLRKNQI